MENEIETQDQEVHRVPNKKPKEKYATKHLNQTNKN